MMYEYIGECLLALKDALETKYNVPGDTAANMILSSYVISSIALFPEETLHEDIETTADYIYEDYGKGD